MPYSVRADLSRGRRPHVAVTGSAAVRLASTRLFWQVGDSPLLGQYATLRKQLAPMSAPTLG